MCLVLYRLRWGIGLIGLAALAVLVTRSCDADVKSVAPTHGAEATIVFSGLEVGTSEPFVLEAGSYRGIWSAWGQTPADPPCTHSVALVTSDGTVVVEPAKSVQVRSTGETGHFDISTAESGEYVLRVRSACAWQVELSPID
jgi:hypothetical protein